MSFERNKNGDSVKERCDGIGSIRNVDLDGSEQRKLERVGGKDG